MVRCGEADDRWGAAQDEARVQRKVEEEPGFVTGMRTDINSEHS